MFEALAERVWGVMDRDLGDVEGEGIGPDVVFGEFVDADGGITNSVQT